jgi:pimeloyl-ACP methyl ester carboxylesterase
MINDPGGELREAMYNVVDHPIASLQQFREHLVSTYGEEQARVMIQSVADAMSDIIKAGGELSRSKVEMITCPVLLITGEHDMFAPPKLVCELAAHLRDAEMLMAQSAEHFIFLDCPKWLRQTILEWMRKL